MGMDVYGKKPSSEVGKYFRANVWSWHPLWTYCATVAPKTCGKVANAHSNDGDGLGVRDSKALARALLAELDSGRTKKYAAELAAKLAALPKEKCTICGGTGKRATPPVCGPGDMHCNGCDGAGERQKIDAWYGFEEDRVRRFAEFLADCGGFEIC
jgi:hypothetical protein